MLDRFTEQARQVVVRAQAEARMLQHEYIGTEHLLLGLLGGEGDIAAQVLAGLDITAARVREQIVPTTACDENAVTEMPFTPDARKALARALREALSLGHHCIDTEHILLGLLYEDQGVVPRMLSGLEAEGGRIRERVVRALWARAAPKRDIDELSDADLDDCISDLMDEPIDEQRDSDALDVSSGTDSHVRDLRRANRARHLRRAIAERDRRRGRPPASDP